MVKTLLHTEILQNGAQIHLTRAMLSAARPKTLHDHDFFELFWVQNGKVRHHQPDGIETLIEGDTIFLQPGHAHALQGRGADALVVSISIHPDTIGAIVERHPSLNDWLFWSGDGPVKTHRDIRQLAAMNHAAVQLEQSHCDRLAAEAFILPLCADLKANDLPSDTPSWLSSACRAAKDPSVFRAGSGGLVALTGKAHPHVSRTMRRYFGVTPSDYVNQIRMEFAARMLTTDSSAVSQIAEECGIPNMSHFHKLFRQAHGLTPLQYRQKYQRGVIQP
ncbi:MAG: AraC family transcriptional regulator [Pseudomonadota bacterium]